MEKITVEQIELLRVSLSVDKDDIDQAKSIVKTFIDKKAKRPRIKVPLEYFDFLSPPRIAKSPIEVKMKKLIASLFAMLISATATAQTYNLVRSINTNNETQSPFLLKVEDTADNRSYTHTGKMMIQNGQVVFDTLECIDDVCFRDRSTRAILFVDENLKSVAIEDEDSILKAKLLRIISTQPNIILLDTNRDGTVLLTEWQLVQ